MRITYFDGKTDELAVSEVKHMNYVKLGYITVLLPGRVTKNLPLTSIPSVKFFPDLLYAALNPRVNGIYIYDSE
jgi:hypothetical protein